MATTPENTRNAQARRHAKNMRFTQTLSQTTMAVPGVIAGSLPWRVIQHDASSVSQQAFSSFNQENTKNMHLY